MGSQYRAGCSGNLPRYRLENFLFRQEAIDAKGSSLLGRINLAPPASFGALTGIVLLIVATSSVFLCLFDYTRHVSLEGRLAYAHRPAILAANQRARVSEILVDAGDSLSQGDIVATLEVPELFNDAPVEQRSDSSAAQKRVTPSAAISVGAPSRSIVSDVRVNSGQWVDAGQTLVVLQPDPDVLIAKFHASGAIANFISVGDRVSLRYGALSHDDYYSKVGVVQRVTPAVPSVLDGQHARDSQERFEFEVDINLDPVHGVNGDIQSVSQKPMTNGTAVSMDIIQEKRRLVDWLFEPSKR